MSGEPAAEPDEGPNYKIRSFSFYPDDLTRLDRIVEALKARGAKRVTRSRVLRIAIMRLDGHVGLFDDDAIDALDAIK